MEFTISECEEWLHNKNVNPRTKKKITAGKGIYNELEKACALNNIKSPSNKNGASNDDLDEISYATAQIILAALYGDTELTIRDPPLKYISEACTNTRKAVESWLNDPIPGDLPLNVNQNVSTDIYSITVQKKWKEHQHNRSTKTKSISNTTLSSKELMIHIYYNIYG